MQRRSFITAAATTAAAFALPTLRAQASVPTGPVRMVVGFPAGGGTDVLARILAQKLGADWGVPVIVENRAGAAGVIAADHVAKQAPDGTTLLMAHINSHGIAPGLLPKLGYSVDKDFTPIALVGKTPTLLVGNKSQAATTLDELVALCRSKPGQVVFGSAGTGSAQHLALETFKARAKIDVLHVPYKGSAPLMTDLMGGHVHYAFEGMTTATPLIATGKVNAVAQTLAQRSRTHPGVPTIAESGYPDFEASIWFGVVAPGGMSVAMADRMNADIVRILALPDVSERLDHFGAEDGGGTRQRYASFMRDEQQKYTKIIRQAGITPEA